MSQDPELERIRNHVERTHARAVDNIDSKLASLEDLDDEGAENRVPMLQERLNVLHQVALPTLVEKHQERYLRRKEQGFSRSYQVDFYI